MTPKGYFEINWPLANAMVDLDKVLLVWETNGNQVLLQPNWNWQHLKKQGIQIFIRFLDWDDFKIKRQTYTLFWIAPIGCLLYLFLILGMTFFFFRQFTFSNFYLDCFSPFLFVLWFSFLLFYLDFYLFSAHLFLF